MFFKNEDGKMIEVGCDEKNKYYIGFFFHKDKLEPIYFTDYATPYDLDFEFGGPHTDCYLGVNITSV